MEALVIQVLRRSKASPIARIRNIWDNTKEKDFTTINAKITAKREVKVIVVVDTDEVGLKLLDAGNHNIYVVGNLGDNMVDYRLAPVLN